MDVSKKVELLERKPGDKFVLHIEGRVSSCMAKTISDSWKSFAGDEPLLILDGGMKLSVVRSEESGRTWDDGLTCIDSRTGRPYGDHGSAVDAIEFSLNHTNGEGEAFLRRWMEGSLDDWPEFYKWLKENGK